MTQTSATGGYLLPDEPDPSDPAVPVADAGLDDFLQSLIAGIAGLDAALVRPRYPPQAPPIDTDWCDFAILSVETDANPAIVHQGDGDGSDILQRHEVIEVQVCFHGANSIRYCRQVRDGLVVGQNREALFLNRLGFLDVSGITFVPEYINQKSQRRSCLTFRLNRQVEHIYPVLNLRSAVGDIVADELNQPQNQSFKSGE